MTETIKRNDDVTVSGSIILHDGAAFLKTEGGRWYVIECQEFFDRCREWVRPAETLDAEITVRREISTDIAGEGFNHPPHQVRGSDYSVTLLVIGFERESFHADRGVCQQLVDQQIEKEVQ